MCIRDRYGEMLELLKNVKDPEALLSQLLTTKDLVKSQESINDYLSFKLYNLANVINPDAYATLRLAEAYYHGRGTNQDYWLAFLMYHQVLNIKTPGPQMHAARAYFNLGYMHHYGLGNITRNLTTAEEYYKKAMELDISLSLIVQPVVTLIHLEQLNLGGDYVELARNSYNAVAGRVYKLYNEERLLFKLTFSSLLAVAFVFVLGTKLYLRNRASLFQYLG
eukprot:TRINITY_DN2913_c0_g1_i3.p1 TRINITY_DN2913_c0_g1~~TRINITY_DN2913_c0_g1_i3.p1  ORF type:complete len:222 (+),score=45.20 TRINITY_DN2913_c0_g1_i3:99-764(+)